MKHYTFAQRFSFAWNGLKIAWKTEESFRMHFCISVAELILLCSLGAPQLWKLSLLLAVGAVLSFELANTALEHAVDLLHPEKHPSIKAAKDCAAGAVLLMSLISGGITFWFLVVRFF